jgi:hypothetical protein
MKMKNKKAIEAEKRRQRKEERRAKRKATPSFERGVPTMTEKPTILIVCEGQNTEPSYFKQFRLSSATIKPIGEGYSTVSLVERTIEIAKRGKYDQVWCVFDKDDFGDFNEAIKLAEANNFGVAYSNQAFEYWIILHFDDHQGGGMHRDNYNKKINQLLKPFDLTYDGAKRKVITESLFELLDGIDEKTGQERKRLAIKRAERNYNKLDHVNPAKEESSTTVFRIVKELLKYI